MTIVILLSVSVFAIPVGYSEEIHQHHHEMGKAGHHMEAEEADSGGFGICPVMHNKAREEYSYAYEEKTYYFCCPMCVEQFKEDPLKYISKIKEMKVETFQFGFSPDSIVVKKGDIVKILASSKDVPHGFYIKEYGINAPLKKGGLTKIEFIADKPGEFDILCSIYCGRGHRDMKAKLIVEE